MTDQQQPEGEREVVYVKQASNGMATAALVLGIIGAVTGLIPLFFFVAFVCGALAIVFGLIGRSKAGKEPQVGGKTRATWGFALGIVAIALGIVGVVIIDDAVTELDRELEQLEQEFDEEFGS